MKKLLPTLWTLLFSVSFAFADPVANDDAATVGEGGTISVLDDGATSVLANDTDTTDSAAVVSGPSHASAFTLNGDGTFDYTHDGDEHRTDSFVYEVADGDGATAIATVTIDIAPDNDNAPVAVNDYATVDEGGTINKVDVLANDTDADLPGDVLEATINITTDNGTLTLAAGGFFTYTHDGSETTTDEFSYLVSDGVANDGGTVFITILPVNDLPDPGDDTVTVDEGGTVSVTNPTLLANDTDPDGPDDLEVLTTATTPNSIATENGSIQINAIGEYTYTHDGSETTSDFFDYAVGDGLAVRNGRLDITITLVSDSPVVANPDSAVAIEGLSTSVLDGGADSVLDNDTDLLDNSPLSVVNTGVNATDNGTVELLANGEFTYTHDGSETTSDFFVYSVTDGTDVRAATVTIAIVKNNDAPVAKPDAAVVDEGGTTSILIGGASSVLDNDTDAEGDDLTVTNPGTFDTTNGTVTLAGNGDFTYTHDGSETTADSFDYTISDDGLVDFVAGTAFEFSIDVDQVVNDLDLDGATPSGTGIATFDPETNLFNWTITYDGLTGAATGMHFHGPAASGEAARIDLFIGLIESPAVGSATLTGSQAATLQAGLWYLNVHTAANAAGEIRGQVDVVDTATVSITINPVNTAPVGNDDHMTVTEGGTADNLDAGVTSVLANDTDQDLPGDNLEASVFSGPGHGTLTLNANGTFVYANDGTENVTDSFVYVLDDNAGITTTATVDIWVTLVNDNDPVANYDIVKLTTGGTVSSPNVLANDTDADIDAVLAVNTTPVSDVANGTLVLGADGYFTYTHDGGASTTDSFRYEISDGETTDVATVNIDIFDPINITEQPMDATITVGQMATLTVTTDVTGDDITYQWFQGESGDTTTPVDDAFDALVEILDIIGVVGVDPGSEWGSGDATTGEHTLVRKSSVTQGDADGFVGNEDDLTDEWDGFAQDTFDDLGTHTADAAATDLFFSEYIEGSSNNKAYEIYNGTGAAVDLAGYSVESFNNGATDPTNSLPLIDIADELADGEVLVIGNDSADATILAARDNLVDDLHETTFINGDDALVLKKTTIGEGDAEYNTGALGETTSYWVQISNGDITVDSDTVTVTVMDVFLGVDIEGFPGWKASPWYKNYFAGFWPWIYHDESGWQFVSSASLEEKIFVWDLGIGKWAFLNEESWRFMYIFSRSPFLPEGYYFSFAGNTPALRFFENPEGEIISIPISIP